MTLGLVFAKQGEMWHMGKLCGEVKWNENCFFVTFESMLM